MAMRLSSGPSSKRSGSISKKTPSLGNLAYTGNLYRAPTPSVLKPPAPLQPAPQTYAKNYNTVAAAPSYAKSYTNNLSAIASGGGGGMISPGVVTPAPAPEPPKPLFTEKSSNADIGRVDSTFRDQEINYNTALEKFLADIGLRRTALERDTKFAKEGTAKNREIGMVGVGEDFAARGLGHSGMFMKAKNDADSSYGRQEAAIDNAATDGERDLAFSEGKEKSDHTARIQAARRDALYRLQLNNNLVSQ